MRNLEQAFGSVPASFNQMVETFLEHPHRSARQKVAAPRAVVCVAAVCVLVLGLGAGLGSLSMHAAASATPLPVATRQISAIPSTAIQGLIPATPPPLPSANTPVTQGIK